MDLRIFCLKSKTTGDKEWVSAPSLVAAIKFLHNNSVFNVDEWDDEDELVELPREEWSKHMVTNTEYDENDPDDWKKMTFEEAMQETSRGTDWIATTMYD